MSSYYCDSDAALAHAGLLSYFSQPTPRTSRQDRDGSAQPTQLASSYTIDTKHRFFDEEAQCDSWEVDSTAYTESEGSFQSTRHSHQSVFRSLCEFWSSVGLVTVASCTILLCLDLTLGRYVMGMSLADCVLGKHRPAPPMAQELHFCLASPNREAPGPQTWHRMSSISHNDCKTEMVTLFASPSEGWKLYSDDEISVGHDEHAREGTVHISKFLSSDDVLRRERLGDNIAEEGVLSQSGEEVL